MIVPVVAKSEVLKQAVFDGFLSRGTCIAIVDCRGINVPEKHRHAHLTLSFGYQMKPSMNIRTSLHGIQADISFSGVTYDVVIPWIKVMAIGTDVSMDEAVIWPNDVEDSSLVATLTPSPASSSSTPTPTQNKPGLRLV